MELHFFLIVLGASLLSFVQGILNWVLVICGIGFLIFIHELGHFLVAKYEGVRVEAFALGFGGAIISKKWGGTDYRINIIPLGGYVKMAGDFLGESKGLEDEFSSKKPGQRARILSAGVIMNAIFGLIGMVIAFQVGSKFLVPKVGLVQAGSPAWEADLQKGDVILEVNGNKIYSFSDLFVEVAFSDPKGAKLKINRSGQEMDLTVFPKYNPIRGVSTIGVYPPMSPIMKVKKDSFAHKAGFRSGDIITHVANASLPEEQRQHIAVKNGYEIEEAIANMENSDLAITITRNKKQQVITVSPRAYTVHRIGIRPRFLKIGATKLGVTIPFEKNDVIVKVDGIPLINRDDLQQKLAQSQQQRKFTVLRDGKEQIVNFAVTDATKFVNSIHFLPDLYIGEVIKDYPAFQSLKAGDKIIKINGKQLSSWSDIYGSVQESKDKPMEVTYERNGKVETATIEAKKVDIPVLALTHELTTIQATGFWHACRLGWIHTKNMAKHIVLMIQGIFSQKVSSKNLGGPVTIFAASHTYLELGLGRFIHFLAIISINLAIINLLPIPVLDGGHLLLIAAEKINGKPLSEKALIWINYAGFLFLVFLIIYVTANDVQRLFG